MARILVAEDEPGIAMALEDDLTMEGYDVEVAGDGELASRRAREGDFDLVLLDVMLPRKSGFDVCRELRRAGLRVPIMMLTAKTQESDKVMGLDLGADDYVTKPYSPHELRARVRALLRRIAPAVSAEAEVVTFGENEIDLARGEVPRACPRDHRAGIPVAHHLRSQPRPASLPRPTARAGLGARSVSNRTCGGQPGAGAAEEN